MTGEVKWLLCVTAAYVAFAAAAYATGHVFFAVVGALCAAAMALLAFWSCCSRLSYGMRWNYVVRRKAHQSRILHDVYHNTRSRVRTGGMGRL